MSERKFIPVTVESGDTPSLCETSCNGACCQVGVTIALFPDEAERMRSEWGAQLEAVGRANPLTGVGGYRLLENCPQLTITEQMGVCAVWGEEDWRPIICDDFTPGSIACNELRPGGASSDE